MRKQDLLQEIYQKELKEEEADETLSRVLDSDGAGDVKHIFLLSDIEWTAKAKVQTGEMSLDGVMRAGQRNAPDAERI